MEEYVEPTRMGTRRGNPIGMSREKFLCAQAMALHSEISDLYPLSEICSFICGSETSVEMVRKWRTEKHFKDVSRQAARSFASFIIDQILRSEDYYKAMILIESLVLLPGFFITDNKYIYMIKVYIDKIKKFPEEKEHYSNLLNCLTAFRDILRIYMDMLPEKERVKYEEELYEVLNPLLKMIDLRVKKANKNDYITEDLATAIDAIKLSITFIISYSKVVRDFDVKDYLPKPSP